MLVLLTFTLIAESYAQFESSQVCTANQQMNILPTLLPCEPRPTVVPLELPNATYVHMAPNHVSVNRCGGSCTSRFHSCMPATTTTRSIEILMIRHSTTSGSTPSECATALVEEHTSCSCGCKVNREECSPVQMFMEQECRCVCADDSARASCLAAGKYWNPVSCSCMCRNPITFPTCPTGYYFDSDTECTCVPLGENASTILEIVVLVLLTSCLVLGYSGFRLLRQSPDRRRDSGMVGQKSTAELRMLFTQISRSHGPPTPSGEGGLSMAGSSSDCSMLFPGPARPRASSHSFFSRGRYEEIREETQEETNEDSK